jgi:peptide/nickel transport system substrate-binding protein
VRNPRYRQWSAQAQPGGYPDRIVLRLDVPPAQAVADVEHGGADVLLSPARQRRPAGHALHQPAAHRAAGGHHLAGPEHPHRSLQELAARQAVNDAINRNTVLALNGGPLAVHATCQILPPTMPGYRPYCPYTILPGPGGDWTAPDLATARRLVQDSGTGGDRVTVLYSNEGTDFASPATARYLVSVLDELGYRASLRMTRPIPYWSVLADSRDQVQAGFSPGTRTTRRPRTSSTRCPRAAPSSQPARTTPTTRSSATRGSTPRLNAR